MKTGSPSVRSADFFDVPPITGRESQSKIQGATVHAAG